MPQGGRRDTIMVMLRASSQPVDGGVRQQVSVAGHHVLHTDEPPELGGTDTAATPHELLAAALASCVSTMIVLAARARGWEAAGVRVDVAYDHKAVPRRFDVHIELPAGLTDQQRDRLLRVAHTCPVRRALESAAVVEETVSPATRAA
jgi:putative redox protein